MEYFFPPQNRATSRDSCDFAVQLDGRRRSRGAYSVFRISMLAACLSDEVSIFVEPKEPLDSLPFLSRKAV